MKKNLLLFTLALAMINSNSIEAHKHKQNPYYKNILEIPSQLKVHDKIDVGCGIRPVESEYMGVSFFQYDANTPDNIAINQYGYPEYYKGNKIKCKNCGKKEDGYCTITFKKSQQTVMTQSVSTNIDTDDVNSGSIDNQGIASKVIIITN